MSYKLSVIVPSKWPDKLDEFLHNLLMVTADFDSLEIIICLDEGTVQPLWERPNIKYVYEPPTIFISRFFNRAYRAVTAPWILLANDDIRIKTKHWDKLLDLENRNPYSLIYWDDHEFRATFSCHPIVSKQAWDLMDRNGLIFDDWKNMGCDTTLWDTLPNALKVYIPEIEIEHHRYVDDAKNNDILEDYVNYNKKNHIRVAVRDHIMRTNMKPNKVLVGVSTAEMMRNAGFLPYILGLNRPEHSEIVTYHGQSPAQARNNIIRDAIRGNFTHVFFVDDDMAIPPDTLLQLLQHDKDIVLGNYLMRRYPHRPVAFEEAVGNGYHRFLSLTDDVHNLMKITNGGLGCALVKTEVFKTMLGDNDPKEFTWVTLGELVKDGWSDDIAFFNRAQLAGYEMYFDPRAICGHMTTCAIWPERANNGSWLIMYKHPEGNVGFSPKGIQYQ